MKYLLKYNKRIGISLSYINVVCKNNDTYAHAWMKIPNPLIWNFHLHIIDTEKNGQANVGKMFL